MTVVLVRALLQVNGVVLREGTPTLAMPLTRGARPHDGVADLKQGPAAAPQIAEKVT